MDPQDWHSETGVRSRVPSLATLCPSVEGGWLHAEQAVSPPRCNRVPGGGHSHLCVPGCPAWGTGFPEVCPGCPAWGTGFPGSSWDSSQRRSKDSLETVVCLRTRTVLLGGAPCTGSSDSIQPLEDPASALPPPPPGAGCGFRGDQMLPTAANQQGQMPHPEGAAVRGLCSPGAA